METTSTRLRYLILPPPSLFSPPSLPAIPLILFSNRTSSSDSICYSSRSDVRKPNWDASGTKRSKFYPYTELHGDDDDDDDDGGDGFFGFGESKKKERSWWSDDAGEYEDEGDDDEFWGFKILKVFGWMVPAILISMLLGTGPNALFMAVALPLAQTAVSLAVERVWGMEGQTSKPMSRNRNRSKPFRSSTNGARKRKRDADFVGSRESKSTSSPSSQNGHPASTSFGGWDELDRVVDVMTNVEEGEEKQQKNISKVGKRLRNKGSPLLVRLLVAVFPLLGSWARFL